MEVWKGTNYFTTVHQVRREKKVYSSQWVIYYLNCNCKLFVQHFNRRDA